MVLLRDVLIARNQLDSYFEGHVPVTLWRAIRKSSSAAVFDFVEEAHVLSNGRPRPADITIEMRDGEKWVSVKDRPRGVSTFDQSGLPRGNGWNYVCIPRGTILPEGLAIVRDQFNHTFGATHYTIAPAHDMPLTRFKALLQQLACQLTRKTG